MLILARKSPKYYLILIRGEQTLLHVRAMTMSIVHQVETGFWDFGTLASLWYTALLEENPLKIIKILYFIFLITC